MVDAGIDTLNEAAEVIGCMSGEEMVDLNEGKFLLRRNQARPVRVERNSYR
jgi:hypothetical protein